MGSSFLQELFGSRQPSESISLFRNNPYKRSDTLVDASQKGSFQDSAGVGERNDLKQKKQKRKRESKPAAEDDNGGATGAKELRAPVDSAAPVPLQSSKKEKRKKIPNSLSAGEEEYMKVTSKLAGVDGSKKAARSRSTAMQEDGNKERSKNPGKSSSVGAQAARNTSTGNFENVESKKRKKQGEFSEVLRGAEGKGNKKKVKSAGELAGKKGGKSTGEGGAGLARRSAEEDEKANERLKNTDGGSPEAEAEGAPSEEDKLKRTIFVGNLPMGLKKKAVARLFVSFGEVESVRLRSVPIAETKLPRKAAIMSGRLSDSRSSMNAYVVFKSEDAAQAALVQNMKEVDGKHVRVDLATPRGGSVGGCGGSVEYDRSRSIFVGNLPFDVEEEELLQVIGGPEAPAELRGSIEAVRVVRDRYTNVGRGIAFVLFRAKGAMRASLSLSGQATLRGRELRITRLAPSTPTKNGSYAGGKHGVSGQGFGYIGGQGGKGRANFDNTQPENRIRTKKRPAVAERKAAMAQLKSGAIPQPKPLDKKRKSVAGGKGPKKIKRKGDAQKKK